MRKGGGCVIRRGWRGEKGAGARLVEQGRYELAQVAQQPLREVDALAQHALHSLSEVVSRERREADHHLVREAAERPPVGGEAVRAALQDFRCRVFGRAADRAAVGAATADGLGHPKVDQLQMAIHRDHDVLGLEIAMDVAARVEELECRHHLRSVQKRPRLGKPLPLDQREEIATSDILHDEKQVVGVLEGTEQPRGVRMRRTLRHLLHRHVLRDRTLDRAPALQQQLLLADGLHRKHLARGQQKPSAAPEGRRGAITGAGTVLEAVDTAGRAQRPAWVALVLTVAEGGGGCTPAACPWPSPS